MLHINQSTEINNKQYRDNLPVGAKQYSNAIMSYEADGFQIEKEWYLHAVMSKNNDIVEISVDLPKTTRDDLRLWPLAESVGFIVSEQSGSPRKHRCIAGYLPSNSLAFYKDGWTIWRVRGGWRYAQLVDGKYTDHSEPMTLKRALFCVLRLTV